MLFKLLRNNNGAKLQSLKSHHFQLYSTPPNSKPTSFSDYLIQSLGFSEQLSLSTSSKISRYRPSMKISDVNFESNYISVVNLFKNYNFNDAQIRKIVSRDPRILLANVDKTLIPKLDFLNEQGFSGSYLTDLIVGNPNLLLLGLNTSTMPAFRVLRDVLGIDDVKDVVAVSKKSNSYTISTILGNLEKNVAFLRSFGIPIELIRKRFIWQPHPLLRAPEGFERIVVRVEETLGVSRESPLTFLTGIHLLASLSDKTIESKLDVFRSFGWTKEDIASILRRYPFCLATSEAKMKASLEYFMNEIGYEPAWLAAHPVLLTYSLEKRIIPRRGVYLALRDKGLIEMDYPLYRILYMAESPFQKQFVAPYKDVLEICASVSSENIAIQKS